MPRAAVADHGVEDDEEFAHGGGDGDFVGFVLGDEAVVEGFDDGIVPYGDDGGHVEGRSDVSPAEGLPTPFAEEVREYLTAGVPVRCSP